MTLRIHAVIDTAVENDPHLKVELRDLLTERFHIENVNEMRYSRFGILSGDVDASVLEELRTVRGLKAISVDELVYAG